MDAKTILESVLVPALVVGAVGLAFGLILAWSARKFAVKIDERVIKVKAALPGVNCGACGQTGCEAFAKAVVAGKAKVDGCPVGGSSVAEKLAEILNVELTGTVAYVARVRCGGNSKVSKPKYEYAGVRDCVAATGLHGGPLDCSYGCVGYGNCRNSCPFGAIEIKDELARIIEEKCQACERCVTACPKNLIVMVPRSKEFVVACRSKDKGAVVRKHCSVGCIGCGKCAKVCPSNAITVTDFLAEIDPKLCTNCNSCLPECPTGSIRRILDARVLV